MVFKLRFLKKLKETTPHREVCSFSGHQLLFVTMNSTFVYNLKINNQNQIENTQQIPTTHFLYATHSVISFLKAD